MLRALLWFWVPVLLVLGAGAGVLQVLGPPPPRAPVPAAAGRTDPSPPAAVASAVPSPTPAPQSEPRLSGPPPPPGAAIPPPDPALLEPAADGSGAMLPRIGADGRLPLRVYAAGYDATDTQPRVALLIADIGMREQDSEAAIRQMPAAVSLAINPYAARLDALLDLARERGHETLVSIPMEPEKYPLNDPGAKALLTGIAPAANLQRLLWALSRSVGYAGATGALGTMRGERFGASDQMKLVFDELKNRGLLYVDPRPQRGGAEETPALPPHRAVDLVIDEPAVGVEIDAKLARLEQIALERGAAIGLVGRPSPVTTERIVVWTRSLPARGVQLVPVSAVVTAPPVRGASMRAGGSP